MKVGGDKTTFGFTTTSFAKPIKKSYVLSIDEKLKMLAQVLC